MVSETQFVPDISNFISKLVVVKRFENQLIK